MTKKLKTYLGQVYREIMRKASVKDEELIEKLALAERLLKQRQ